MPSLIFLEKSIRSRAGSDHREKGRGPRRKERNTYETEENDREWKAGSLLDKVYLIKNYPRAGFV